MRYLRIKSLHFFVLLFLCVNLNNYCLSEQVSYGDEIGKYELPIWFKKANRVHLHTRLWIYPWSMKTEEQRKRPLLKGLEYSWLDLPPFFQAAKHFKAIGADVMTRDVKSHDEPALWPSKVGDILEIAKNRNIAKEIIDRAHGQGLRIVVYYNHMGDKGMEKMHPEWMCREKNNKPVQAKRFNFLCFNSPYVEYTQKRLLELVSMGVDGIYFDMYHQPESCHCKNCQNNKISREDLIEKTFLKWRKAIHSRNPEAVLFISGRFENLSNRLFRISDSTKFEMQSCRKYGGLGDDGISLGLTFFRDATDGRPGYLWWTPVVKSTLKDSARILAHGHVFDFDVWEEFICVPNSDNYLMAQKHVEFGSKISSYLTDAEALRWVIIHYPDGQPDGLKEKQTVLPYYKKLLQAHVPVGIITDTQLAESIPKECKLLILPEPNHSCLSNPNVKEILDGFRSNGGIIIGGEYNVQKAESLLLLAKDSPVRIFDAPSHLQVIPYTVPSKEQVVIAIFNPDNDPVKNITVQAKVQKMPSQILDAVTGLKLDYLAIDDTKVKIKLDRIDTLSLLVIR